MARVLDAKARFCKIEKKKLRYTLQHEMQNKVAKSAEKNLAKYYTFHATLKESNGRN